MRVGATKRRARRRGVLYILTLAVSLVAAVVGLSTLVSLRLQQQAAKAASERIKAELIARSVVDWARLLIQDDSNWRTNRSSGTWISQSFSDGTSATVSVVDPADGNLANDPMQSVVVTGTGVAGAARQKVQVTLYSTIVPIDPLKTALHAAGNIDVSALRTLVLNGAPLSANGTINNAGTVTGSVECNYYTGVGTVSGTVTQNVQAKANPSSTVLSQYQSMATTIPYQSNMQRFVLSSGYNPWGSPNANGIYYINTGGSDITLKRFLVNGTLVIQCGSSRTVSIEDAALLYPNGPDYATIITDGSIDLKLQSASTQLSESSEGTNFNPSGAPYSGVSDTDQADTYPNEIRGLVHAKGTVTFSERTKIVGAIITEKTGSAVALNNSPIQIDYSTTLTSNPPIGYRAYQMKVQANSWLRAVDATVLGSGS